MKDREHQIIENIPLFPLGIIVLPGETRFLHIFEQRYKNLFEDTNTRGYFGIPFVSKGRIMDTGSLVRFEKTLAKYPNGEADIAVKGVDILTVKNYSAQHPERLYPFGDIETLNKDLIEANPALLSAFDRFNNEVLKIDLEKLSGLSFYLIANSVGMSETEKFEMLSKGSDEAVNRYLASHIKMRTILASQQKSMQDYFCLN